VKEIDKETTMHSAILNVTFDCHDPRAVATFWSGATGYSLQEVDTPGNDYWVASSAGSTLPRLVFVSVPENKVVKNRVHLDLIPVGGDQEAELERLLGLGARIVDDRRELSPGGWVVMADPEGNEFCLE
jgi:predicted enzyme related to lactoylglutathione lyase